MTAPTQQFNTVQFIVDDLSQKIGQLTLENAALRAEIKRREQEDVPFTETTLVDPTDQ